MYIEQEDQDSLAIVSPPGGKGARFLAILGQLGCAAPLIFVGAFLAYFSLQDAFSPRNKGDSDWVLFMLGSLVPLITGLAFLAYFRTNARMAKIGSRCLFRRGEPIKIQKFDLAGEVFDTQEYAVEPGSRLLAEFESHRPSRGASIEVYSGNFQTAGGEKVQLWAFYFTPGPILEYLEKVSGILDIPVTKSGKFG